MKPSNELRREWELRRGTFAAEADPSGPPLTRLVWFSVGLCALGLGIVGVFLPVLPTTPLVILAAACFARSSARFYGWVMGHAVFGPLVYAWRERRIIPARAKAVAIALIVFTFGVSIAFFVPILLGKVAMAMVGLSVIAWLLSVPSDR